jgi:hypothetical protein
MTGSEETTTMKKDTTPKLGKVIQIDEQRIQGHLDKMVRRSVEETLNALLDAEAGRSARPHAMNAPLSASIGVLGIARF